MGTFAQFFTTREKGIPENKRDEFEERLEKLFQAGGMMQIEWINLYGKEIATLRKVTMDENGIDVFYNYLEDDYWENAGYNKKNMKIWSNKIGWNNFAYTMIAAYILYALYSEDAALVLIDGMRVVEGYYVGWINHLFNEKYDVKNLDLWKAFEMCHFSVDIEEEYIDWNIRMTSDMDYTFISECEIHAVLYGVDATMQKISNGYEKFEGIISGLKEGIGFIEEFYQKSSETEEEQLHILMNELKNFYEFGEKYHSNINFEKYDKRIARLRVILYLCDAPAFIVKKISEVYEKDFWDLWKEIYEKVERKSKNIYQKDQYYVTPVSTVEYLKMYPDDMILFWEEDGNIELTDEQWKWFDDLKKLYDKLYVSNFRVKNPLRYIVELMEMAEDEYHHIFTFTDFFEETCENINDKKYLVLWRLYEIYLRDEELRKIGSVIFVPDGPEHEHEGIHYLGEQPKHRLITNWQIMAWNKKKNQARMIMRSYMALVANKSLRQKVFGF